jgi:hypothetical protein
MFLYYFYLLIIYKKNFKIKNIILIYFEIKRILKSNYNYIFEFPNMLVILEKTSFFFIFLISYF